MKNFIKIRLAVVATIATTAIIVIGIIITMLAIKQYNNPRTIGTIVVVVIVLTRILIFF